MSHLWRVWEFFIGILLVFTVSFHSDSQHFLPWTKRGEVKKPIKIRVLTGQLGRDTRECGGYPTYDTKLWEDRRDGPYLPCTGGP